MKNLKVIRGDQAGHRGHTRKQPKITCRPSCGKEPFGPICHQASPPGLRLPGAWPNLKQASCLLQSSESRRDSPRKRENLLPSRSHLSPCPQSRATRVPLCGCSPCDHSSQLPFGAALSTRLIHGESLYQIKDAPRPPLYPSFPFRRAQGKTPPLTSGP